jgi:serine/threonine protein kinase
MDFRYQWSGFLLQEQIGQGATGRVYRALHKPTGQQLAVKFIRRSLSENRSILERFASEFQIVRDLAHPGIVRVHGLGRAARRGLFLVMDLVPGEDLDHASRTRTITAPLAVSWLREAAHIIHFAHERSVIHCDLKPGNLLVDDSGNIRVTDFGFAMHIADMLPTRLAGTPAFMAPEQIDATWGPISPRTDVWGLGSILFFLLTGQPPNSGKSVAEVLAQVVSDQPVILPHSGLIADQPDVKTILQRCLTKNPAHRFSSALELAGALSS